MKRNFLWNTVGVLVLVFLVGFSVNAKLRNGKIEAETGGVGQVLGDTNCEMMGFTMVAYKRLIGGVVTDVQRQYVLSKDGKTLYNREQVWGGDNRGWLNWSDWSTGDDMRQLSIGGTAVADGISGFDMMVMNINEGGEVKKVLRQYVLSKDGKTLYNRQQVWGGDSVGWLSWSDWSTGDDMRQLGIGGTAVVDGISGFGMRVEKALLHTDIVDALRQNFLSKDGKYLYNKVKYWDDTINNWGPWGAYATTDTRQLSIGGTAVANGIANFSSVITKTLLADEVIDTYRQYVLLKDGKSLYSRTRYWDNTINTWGPWGNWIYGGITSVCQSTPTNTPASGQPTNTPAPPTGCQFNNQSHFEMLKKGDVNCSGRVDVGDLSVWYYNYKNQ